MKLNSEFSICEVAGKSFLAPTGSRVMDVNKMMDLNETSLFIINLLKEKDMTQEALLDKLLAEYEIDRKTADSDLREFIDKAVTAGVIIK